MKEKIIRFTSFLLSVIFVIFSIRFFYFETNIGYNKTTFGTTSVAMPLCLEVLIFEIITPGILYIGFQKVLFTITENFESKRKHKK